MSSNGNLKVAGIVGLVAGVAVGLALWLTGGGSSSENDSSDVKQEKNEGGEERKRNAGALKSNDDKLRGSVTAKISADTATKEEVLSILESVVSSQAEMKELMKDLTARLTKAEDADALTLEKVYRELAASQPRDPLDAAGVSMTEFDALVERFSDAPEVRAVIHKIMGPPSTPVGPSAREISPRMTVEIHRFMLEELKKFVESFKQDKRRDDYDMRTVTIAAQAIVGALTQKKFGFSAEDIEAAVFLHHQSLAVDPTFTHINLEMQQVMGELLGTSMTGGTF